MLSYHEVLCYWIHLLETLMKKKIQTNCTGRVPLRVMTLHLSPIWNIFLLSPTGNTVGTLPQIAHPLSHFISTAGLIQAWRKIFLYLFSPHPLRFHWDPYGCHCFLQRTIKNQLIYIPNESQHCLCCLTCHIVEEQQKLRHTPMKKYSSMCTRAIVACLQEPLWKWWLAAEKGAVWANTLQPGSCLGLLFWLFSEERLLDSKLS